MSYTCLKRLMTFWAIVKTGTVSTVHFSATPPQGLRIFLPYAEVEEKIILRIYYPGNMRLLVHVGERFVEDLNRLDGKSKAQLVLDGRLSSNNNQGGYTDQELSLVDECLIGNVASATWKCSSPSNAHGANIFNRRTGMLEVVVSGHSMHDFIEIKSMPVVAVSMGVQTSVSDFYKIKDTFLSSLAGTLGIDVTRITIVDVVAGNARRRHLLSESAVVNFEVEPSPVIEVTSEESIAVTEDAGTLAIKITRSVNIVGGCAVRYSVKQSLSDNALAGVNFVATSGVIVFESKEEEKIISIQVLSDPGYQASQVHFTVSISSAENATLGEKQAVTVIVRNVHMPPPLAPTRALSGSTSTGVKLEWSAATWAEAPSAIYNTTLNWEVECVSEGGQYLPVIRVPATVHTQYLGGLTTYNRIQCRARAEAVGWSSWSSLTSMYTLPVCGDGSRHGTENCDDGNTVSGDGCAGSCSVENGYACSSAVGGDICSNGCRNGTKEAGEVCDDGNAVTGDGCDTKCEIERGWQCATTTHQTVSNAVTSTCNVICGDGIRLQDHEGCDDGNVIDGDGCSNVCTVEAESTCVEDVEDKSTCQKCGNGILEVSH